MSSERRKMAAAITYKVLLFGVILQLMSCSATKFLTGDESFYAGAEIKILTEEKIKNQKKIITDLKELIGVKPNSTTLGARPGPWFYYSAGNSEKKKGLNNFIKNKLGRRPVLLSDVQPDKTETLMEAYLDNEGYFGSTVSSQVKTRKKKSIVEYHVLLQKPFRLRNITYPVQDELLLDSTLLYNESLLKEGQQYSLQRLQAEQKRVEELAKNLGYYKFESRYLLFEGDTTVGNWQVDLALVFERGTPQKAMRVYNFESINVFPNYLLTSDSLTVKYDTLLVDNFKYIDNQHAFRSHIITDVINLKPDSIYRRIDHTNTLSRLMSLQTFKFVNIRFIESPFDSTKLHADINLTPQLKKSLRMEVQGISKSNNFIGPGVDITFSNRNFLRGAELFQFKLSGAYQWQSRRQQAGSLSAIEFGAETSLTFPRFIAPFNLTYRSSKYVPKSIIKAGFNFQQRVNYFRLTSSTTAFGYQWRETTAKAHELFPIDLSFVKSGKTSPSFDSLLMQNPVLANSFQNQFIPGLRYTFTFNTQLSDDQETKYGIRKTGKSNFYFQGNVSLSGNILNATQKTFIKNERDTLTLFNLPYSQYAIGETDFRYYLDFDRHNKLAARINIGTGFAYGNSTSLPYIKQFAAGGSNSLRSFPARSVGPGTYNVRTDSTFTSSTYFIDQRADIKLIGSVEYRFDIYKALKGAAFVDAGNIWLVRPDAKRPGGEFEWKTFVGQLAIGTGVGLRYDFNFFVLRFDTAFPVRKPYLPPSEQWVFDQIDLTSKTWRKENVIFNIAIGYPF